MSFLKLFVIFGLILCTTSAFSISPKACVNSFSSKSVKATGDWSIDAGSATNWNAADSKGLMEFDETSCIYILVLTGLKKSFQYSWKVSINDAWVESYGCNGLNGPNCLASTNSDGAIRLMFKPNFNPPQLASDWNVNDCANRPCNGICPTNSFANKIIRTSGDWSIDAGSSAIWNAAEPLGLIEYY
jgi:hypothetical protein